MRVFSALFALSAFAASPDYFPLQVGNQWVYRASRLRGPQVVEVVTAEAIDGNTYYRVRGFRGADALLRMTDDGSLVAYDAAQKQEKPWVVFGAAEGERFATAFDPCSPTAAVTSRSAPGHFPTGDVDNALVVDYGPGSCADAGLTRDAYVPWIGLVQRTETSIAGPVTWDLVYTRLGVTEVSAAEVRFSVTLDRSVYVRESEIPRATARITLRNTGAEPLKLNYPTSQAFDLMVKNEKDEVVYRWSNGQQFLQVLRSEDFAGERVYVVVFRLADPQGQPLPPGNYTVEAWLTTTGSQPYRAQVGFVNR